MENTSRRSRLAPQEFREKLLNQGNKETAEKTQPSKLSMTQKSKIVKEEYEARVLATHLYIQEKIFRKANIKSTVSSQLNWLKMRELSDYGYIYRAKEILENGGNLGNDGFVVKNARRRLQSIALEKEEILAGKKQRPLAKLIAAEERING